ncbi:MAG: recombinase family protein [Planctomycetes bacterium]|nr:recombinase family protein [Planctomycetota bacterium]
MSRHANESLPASNTAVIYARVSSKGQEKEGFSIPAQLELLESYAKQHQFTIAKRFVEAESAKAVGRAAYNEMVEFLKDHRNSCHAILVEKTDRLYRNFRDFVNLEDIGVDVHLVKESTIISEDADSNASLMHGMKVLIAKHFIDNLRAEVKKGMREKAQQGMWPSYAPIGYKNVMLESGKKGIAIDPTLAPIVRQMFEWYATGQYSVMDITRMTKEAGAINPKTKRPFHSTTVWKILNSLFYTGWFKWAKSTHKGTHEPIITQELFDRAKKVRERRSEGTKRTSRHDFAYSGLIKCAVTGRFFVGEAKISKGKVKRRHVYYRPHYDNLDADQCPAKPPMLKEEELDQAFLKVLSEIRIDDQVMEIVGQALREGHKEQKEYYLTAMANLKAEHTKLQHRIDAMYTDKLDGKISDDDYQRRYEEFRIRQTEILADIDRHQYADDNYLADGLMLFKLAQNALGLFQKQTPSERRRLLHVITQNCEVKDGQLKITLQQPFEKLRFANDEWERMKKDGKNPVLNHVCWYP